MIIYKLINHAAALNKSLNAKFYSVKIGENFFLHGFLKISIKINVYYTDTDNVTISAIDALEKIVKMEAF